MSYNWSVIGSKIYGILSSSGYGIQMWNDKGKITIDPQEAIRFLISIKSKNPSLESFNVLIGLHDEDAYSHLDFRTPKTIDDADFKTLTNLKDSIKKNLGDVEGLKINWVPFGSTITYKNDPVDPIPESIDSELDDNKEEIAESNDISKVHGTSKSSFQKVGRSKIIVRHTDTVDETKQGSRWRKIRSVFIETKDGERFKYPRPHIAGARALARHLSEDGNINDDIASGILKMSEDFMKLKHAKSLLRKNGEHDKSMQARDAMQDVNVGLKRMCGPRGYQSSNDIISKHDISGINVGDDDKKILTDDKLSLTEYDTDCLDTAAKYNVKINMAINPNNVCPVWLSTMLSTLIDKLSDQENVDKVSGIIGNIDNNKMPTRDDINWVTNIVKGMNNSNNTQIQEPDNSEIIRIKQLSGI